MNMAEMSQKGLQETFCLPEANKLELYNACMIVNGRTLEVHR